MPFSSYFFVVVEKNPFFATDLHNGLVDACAGCDIAGYRFAGEASADLGRVKADFSDDRQIVVLCSAGVDEIDDSGLAAAVRRFGATMVMMQDAPGAEKAGERGWHLLSSPFTSRSIGDLVAILRRVTAAE
ncbi:MAG: hypothetical protein Q4F71_07110 [Paracoccus sp. (in: a-proteobacteria)]|nr:hypothetical protein [Paracoccus sp. (in: a-proteobacteria)]